MNENLVKRKSPRLKEYDYNDTAVYFTTICVQPALPGIEEMHEWK